MNNSNLSDENFDALVDVQSDISHTIEQLLELKLALSDIFHQVDIGEHDTIADYLCNLNKGINNVSHSITLASRGVKDSS
jgi:hypothetical protein